MEASFIERDCKSPPKKKIMISTAAEARNRQFKRISVTPEMNGFKAYKTAYDAMTNNGLEKARFTHKWGPIIVPLDEIKKVENKPVAIYYANEAVSSEKLDGKIWSSGWYCGTRVQWKKNSTYEYVFGDPKGGGTNNVAEIELDPDLYAYEHHLHAADDVPNGTWFYIVRDIGDC